MLPMVNIDKIENRKYFNGSRKQNLIVLHILSSKRVQIPRLRNFIQQFQVECTTAVSLSVSSIFFRWLNLV